MQLHDLSIRHRWAEITRAEFNLTPSEFATLLAIVVYWETTMRPMPREELERFIHEGDFRPGEEPSMAAVARLFRAGLVNLVGYREKRSYAPLAAGCRRVRS